MELEDRIIWIYLRIEETYEQLTRERPLRSQGFAPALSDAELLTMEIVGEMQGRHEDKAIWRYFREHWRDWFPALGSYKNFTKHAANLVWIKEKIMAALFPAHASLHIVDGVPMPVCHKARASRSRTFRDVAAWGYCAAKDEHYFGLRGHPVINMKGQIVSFPLTAANVGEREVLFDLVGKIKGLLLGDKGFLSRHWQSFLTCHDINLQTPLRDNMPDPRPKEEVNALLRIRRLVETAIGILSEKFAIATIKARDIWHLSSRIYRKIIAYNFYLELRSS